MSSPSEGQPAGGRGEVHHGRHFAVARRRGPQGAAVVIKSAGPTEGPGSERALEREHAVLQRLDVPGVVRAVELRRHDGSGAELVLEDAGPTTLGEWLRGPLGVDSFLVVATQLAGVLERVHGRGVIHLDLEPSNVVMSDDGVPTLIDFDRAATAAEVPPAAAPHLERALPYVAPEQTGRLNRLVDHRSDLYSLGVIFYEMLTGAPPFRSDDPLEIVHAHLTRAPVSPSLIAPGVPPALSGIVLKLLEKLPEARYQSAAALAADLSEASRRWRETGAIEPFELGNLDLALQLPLPRRLYGRDGELAELRAALTRCRAGACEVALVTGEPGVGKSALVSALRDDVVAGGGWFLSGKFDVRAANAPFAPLREALRELVDEVLATPAALREELVARARRAVGASGRALTAVAPELEALLGEQPALTPLDPAECKTRLHITLQALLQAFASDGGVLALFLDDLQWADAATIEALGALAADPESRHLLLLGAFRPKEVPARHALTALEAGLERMHPATSRIDLAPLRLDAYEQLLADVLRCDLEEARPLADVLLRKTAGNPFFLRQLLRTLQKDGLLRFDVRARTWSWSLEKIERVGIMENVVELLVDAIRRLPGPARQLLPFAACVGKRVDTGTLAWVSGGTTDDVFAGLAPALGEGLMVAEVEHGNVAYSFAHDRVQQAAYSLLPSGKQKEVHLRVGRRLFEAPAREDLLFNAANQLNLGASLLSAPAEKLELARLDLRAGRKAKAAAAFGPALGYLSAGIAQLPPEAWQREHPLAMALYREAAECAYVSAEYALSDSLVDEATTHAASAVERAELRSLRVISATARAAWTDALAHARGALADLGMTIPTRDIEARIAEEQRAVEVLSEHRSVAALVNASPISSPKARATLKLLVDMQHPAWFQDRSLFRLLALLSMRFILEHGNAPESPTAFCAHAMCLSATDQFTTADGFAKVAIARAEQLGDEGQLAHALFIHAAFVREWLEPYASALPQLRRALDVARKAGELRVAGYALSGLVLFAFAAGREIDQVMRDVEEDLAFLHKTRNEPIIGFHLCYRQALRSLKGLTRARNSFEEEGFDEQRFLEAARPAPSLVCLYHVRRLQTSFVFRDFERANAHAEAAAPLIEFLGAHVGSGEYNVYRSLTYAAMCDAAPAAQRAAWLAKIEANQRQLATWASSCPDNFRHMHQLICAEVSRLQGRHREAVDLYEQSMEGAANGGFLQDEAVASELAARHALSHRRSRVAALYADEARSLYARWGASEKVRALDEELPAPHGGRATPAATVLTSELDLESLHRAAETVSAEVVFERLLEKLIEVCVQAAGAQRVVLVLEEDGKPFVRASGGAAPPVVLERTPLAETSSLSRQAVEWVRVARAPLVLDDAGADPRWAADPYVASHRSKSLLVMPVQRQSALVAVLYFENDLVTHAFTAARRGVLELLSAHIATSLENSLLFGKLREEVAERTQAEAAVRFLASAGAELAESLDYPSTLAKLTRLALPTLGDWCVIDLVEEDGSVHRAAVAHVDPEKDSLVQALASQPPDWGSPQPAARVLRSGEPLLIESFTADELRTFSRDDENLQVVEAIGVSSALAVPMAARGNTIGVITCALSSPGRRYGPTDVALAQELARRAAMAIDNARMFQREKEAVERREDFLAVAAHELNTPVTSLKLLVQGLLRRDTPIRSESLKTTLSMVERQIVRLARQIDGLLDLSRIRSRGLVLHREPVDLAAVVRDVAERFSEEASRVGSELSVFASGPVIGDWDRSRLEQLVTNLLTNALKFGEGKPIDVEVSGGQASAVLTVRDRGIGIPAERLPRIFERFERAVTARQYGGLGLGLFIVRSIVEAMGGTVRVESEPGAGSTFVVELPYEEA